MQYSPTKMKQLLEENDFSFKKKFGQNFIIDENIIDNIIKKSDIDSNTLVIEVGPGSGSLTKKLVESAGYVLCYEIDQDLKNILKNNLQGYHNYEIIFDDILKRNVLNDIKNKDYQKLYLVANLPYYITTPIIIKMIEDKVPFDKMVVMVQKEVGDRFRATPGTKAYGSLSIFLNYYFSVKKILDVSKNVFLPKPNVDSIVVEFTKKEHPKVNEEVFFSLVKDSFSQKRKTIKNNLKNYDLNKVEEVLKKYGYDLSVRAEQLSIEVFVDIANYL